MRSTGLKPDLVAQLEAAVEGGAQVDLSVNPMARLFFEGLAESLAHNAAVLLTDVDNLMCGKWRLAPKLIRITSLAHTLVEHCGALPAACVSKSELLLQTWADRLESLVKRAHALFASMDGVLRHKANQLELSDGGGGVAIKLQSVRLAMVLWVRIARLATLTRAHNARGNSQTHAHEQSIGILNQYTSNRAPRDNIAGFSGFQALSSLDLATVDWGKHSEAKKEEMLASAYEKQ